MNITNVLLRVNSRARGHAGTSSRLVFYRHQARQKAWPDPVAYADTDGETLYLARRSEQKRLEGRAKWRS